MTLDDEIAKTQKMLGRIIDRPQLKEKLLTKPPFRFLHDIISAVTKSTGFAEGLYEEKELDSGSIRDKEAKLSYLKKIMDYVSICIGSDVDVRGAKVVAGLEPEKTNLFLQQLAQCASDISLDFREAAQMTLRGASPSASTIPRITKAEPVSRNAEFASSEEKNEQRPSSQIPPASRAGTRTISSDSNDVDTDPMSRLGRMTLGPSELDQQIEACDGSPSTTQKLLATIITKPKLSEKLLGKPPFRFLHDIISEVIRQTSFASGLYDEIECDSSKVTDKTSKIRYLAKMVKLVGMQLNTIIEARPTKIVSGLEPNNTNRLLQLLAVAASSMPNSDHAVQAVLASENLGGGESAVTSTIEDKDELPNPQMIETPVPYIEKNRSLGLSSDPLPSRDAKTTAIHRNSSDKDAMEDLDASQPKRSTRPTTARRRPPKYKESTVEVQEIVGLDNVASTKGAIIVDGDDDAKSGDGREDVSEAEGLVVASPEISANGKSKLVREIQEEERALVKRANNEKENTSGGIRFGRIDRAVAGCTDKINETDLNELQDVVQVLCRTTNPLCKCMDYVHEDLATMHKESEKWEEEYKLQLVQHEQEIKLTNTVTQPLRLKLTGLDHEIVDEQRHACSIKACILKQEHRTGQLLRMVSTSQNFRV